MRQSIFRAKRVDNDEWVKGYFAPIRRRQNDKV